MRAYRNHDSHSIAITEWSPGMFSIKGDLTFATVNQAAVQALSSMHNGQAVSVDLQAVTIADSAGLALMIEWLKLSLKKNCTLKFLNVSPQLMAIAKICDYDQYLPLTHQAVEQSSN